MLWEGCEMLPPRECLEGCTWDIVHHIDSLSECLSSDLLKVHEVCGRLWETWVQFSEDSVSQFYLYLLSIQQGTQRTKSPGLSETHYVAKSNLKDSKFLNVLPHEKKPIPLYLAYLELS